MRRLTERDEYGNAEIIALSDVMPELYAGLSFEETNALTEALNRLAAYEDAGLEPKRVAELARAEKDGRLVVLPCKVGDTVYMIRGEEIITATVESAHLWISGKWKINVHTDRRYTHWVGYEIRLDDFGKTVFLTREEAEAALKKREEKMN